MGPVAIFHELVNVAERARIAVRIEPLDPDLFERRKGGMCRIEGAWAIVVDERASIDEKIAVVAHALATVDLDAVYMLPELRERIDREKSPIR